MRKLRTRQHVIEDLSYNFVEKQVLLAFGTFERYNYRQYSYDGHIFTYDEKGQPEGGWLFVQLKSTDKLKYSEKNKGFELRLDRRDMELWLNERYPVLVVLYDAKNDTGYFVELGGYFDDNRAALKKMPKFMRIFLPSENIFEVGKVKELQLKKNKEYAINNRF